MSTAISQPDRLLLNSLTNGEARSRLIALLDGPDGAAGAAATQLQKFASDNEEAAHGPVSRRRMLEEYPALVAAVVWQSASYHRPAAAADVMTAFLRAEDTASELHFHMALVGKIGLKEANDDIVIRAAENMLHLQQRGTTVQSWTHAIEAVAEAVTKAAQR